MNRQQLKKILQQYNLSPNHLLGQNFLVDDNVLKKIIETADLKKEDVVLEVGPGLGILTFELAKSGAKIIAVEKDKQLAEILKNISRENKTDNLEIIQDDILDFIKTENRQLKTNYKLVANIPYYLTSHLIRNFLESDSKPQTMILMIQKEVAERICAKPPEMSLLAASVQFYAQPKIISRVSKNSFWPAPKVDSAIIEIKPKKEIPADPQKFFKALKAGFSAPRKQLGGNLEKATKKSRREILEILQSLNIDPKRRAETLSVEEWVELGEAISKLTQSNPNDEINPKH